MFSSSTRFATILATVLMLGGLSPQAPALQEGSRPLTTAGTSEKALAEFLGKLKKAVEKDDRAAVAKLVSFPLRAWNGKADVQIKDTKQFLAQYSAIFSADVKETVAHASVETAWANSEGVMFESGRIWLRVGADGSLRIVTIQET